MVWVEIARAVFALTVTLALLAGVAYGARRLGMLQPGLRGERRMKVTESLLLDPRRRLVIVRCDAREHVLLLSPTGDRIVAHMDARPETQA